MPPWSRLRGVSTHRTLTNRGAVIPALLPRGLNGRPLCRMCHKECPVGRMSFCGDDCVHEWKLRSDPAYLRRFVFKRDRGVCRVCRMDTESVLRDLLDKPLKERKKLCAALGFPWHRVKGGSLWDADHIQAVAEGGGLCGIDNIQSLCAACHRRKTAAQVTRKKNKGTKQGCPSQ